MNKQIIDRFTEAAAVLCVAAALVILGGWVRAPDATETLAGLSVQRIEDRDLEEFRTLVQEARRKIDSNMDPGPLLNRLKEEYSGRHEVWSLDARNEESVGRYRMAMLSYARAVRLEPDYLDKNSVLYLGRRIEETVSRAMEDLFKARDSGLDEQGKTQVKAGYFLKRRLAGGCE